MNKYSFRKLEYSQIFQKYFFFLFKKQISFSWKNIFFKNFSIFKINIICGEGTKVFD
jgi:hypothetical protein